MMTTTPDPTSRWTNGSRTPTDRAGIRDLLEWAAAAPFILLVRWLPGSAAACAGNVLGEILWRLLGRRRQVASSNVARASMPQAAARSSFRHFGRVVVECLRFEADAPDVHWREPDVIGDLLAQGGPFIVLSGHLGNWELASRAIGRRASPGRPLHVVVAGARNRFVERFLTRLRRRWGIIPCERNGGLRGVLRAIDAGCPVGTAADQWPGRGGAELNFLGRSTRFTDGMIRLAAKRRVPVVAVAAVRQRSHYVLHAELVYDGHGPEGARELLERWVRVLEREVCEHPEQYLWMHRRWKERKRSG